MAGRHDSSDSANPAGTLGASVAVLLAAGAGRRFEGAGHKLLARLTSDGPTICERALRSALDAEVGPVVVVTGSLDRAALGAADPLLDRLLDDPRVSTRHHPDWATGQAGSLRAGITAAAERGADAVVVGLADQPFIDAEAWRRVARGLGAISVATYDGRRGNPVRLHASMWGLLPTSGDEGARVVMRSRPDLVVEVPCPGSPADIDTVEDIQRWQSN